jgi:hypothetical protein
MRALFCSLVMKGLGLGCTSICMVHHCYSMPCYIMLVRPFSSPVTFLMARKLLTDGINLVMAFRMQRLTVLAEACLCMPCM